jgi:hypothetical protein
VPRHPRGTIRHLRGGRRAWTITRTISSPRPDRARTRPATRAYTRTMTPPPRRGTPRRTARRWRFRSEEANHRSAKRTRSATARRRRKPKGRNAETERDGSPSRHPPRRRDGGRARPARGRVASQKSERLRFLRRGLGRAASRAPPPGGRRRPGVVGASSREASSPNEPRTNAKAK